MRTLLTLILIATFIGGCDKKVKIRVDGSSTVFPISEAMAEKFQDEHSGIAVNLGISGTGGGFKKFLSHETDINDASRPIKQKEADRASAEKIGYIELPVAFDGISIIVNPKNDWVQELSVAQLKKLWAPDSKVKNWNELDPSFPDRPIKLYGPGTESGTYDYFTEAVNGESGACRGDFTKSEDDNFIIRGVESEPNGLAFVGFAYYVSNKDKLKVVPIRAEGATAAVAPSHATINNGTYAPLARPIFIYVSTQAAQRQEVKDFVHFYLKMAPSVVSEVGYVALPDPVYTLAIARFDAGTEGSAFLGRETRGVPLAELYVEPRKQG